MMDQSEAIVPSVVVMYPKPEGRRHQTVWIGMQNIVVEQECPYYYCFVVYRTKTYVTIYKKQECARGIYASCPKD